ncbi:MAG TPA: LytTR family DNA-binding domain-containing protein [Chitinophagaceae bacterium]|jgi:two-component system LytT family response regulator|nr:LytTR family DNA-binding domain-containing protein [Chitinophagaceae bacterium]
MIRTIIIDDEPSAINVLASLLKKKCREEIEVIATSSSPVSGRMLIEELKPDLVFLDIEMPGMTGIDLVRSFTDPGFRVVFVTAHDDYAVEAFQLSAVNYLLKPIGPESVVKTIDKIFDDIRRNQNMAEPLKKLEKLLSLHSKDNENKIGIAMADKIVFINISDIICCEASSAYTNVFLKDDKKMVASKPLGDFELLLMSHRFFRIHHSYLINLNRIKEFRRHDGGYITMENNKQLEVSRRKRQEFLTAINDFVV